MKYTASQEADKIVEKDVKKIIEIILKYDKPKAIVLFGGFGHGSGSYTKKDGRIIPLNDYDFYIISEKNYSGEELERIGEECSRELGKGGLEIVENFNKKWDPINFFHVDLHSLKPNQLKKLYPTQRTFDLKTSLVVWGDKEILNKIPNIKISKADAVRLLFNKFNHFQIAEDNSNKLKSIYSVKGFLDSAAALLIYYGGYTSYYDQRLERIKQMKFSEEYEKLLEIAIESKLHKGYEIEEIPLEEFFALSKKWVSIIFLKIIKDYLKINETDWEKIAKKIYRKMPYIYFNDYLGSSLLFPSQYYLNTRFFIEATRKGEILPKSLARWRDVGIILGLSMVLYSFGEYPLAEKYLKKITNNTKPLKSRLMKLYSIYYLQKLV